MPRRPDSPDADPAHDDPGAGDGAGDAPGARPAAVRHLVVVLGDQLDRTSAAFDGFDPARDAVWMAEVSEESTHVWSARQRTVLFLSAMRHFAQALREEGLRVFYRALTTDVAATPDSSLGGELAASLQALPVQRVRLVEPGDHRVREQLTGLLQRMGVPLDLLDDTHFLCSRAEFAAHAKGRKQLRMEYFYREMRRRHGVLMAANGADPVGGEWNFDADNREAFPAGGPGFVPATPRFAPDAITREVIDLVDTRFADTPAASHSSAGR